MNAQTSRFELHNQSKRMAVNGTSYARQAAQLVLPKEHGSWSLALEPVALGLCVAPSVGGVGLAMAAVAVFFLRRPLKLALAAKADPRRPMAVACISILSLLTLTGLFLAVTLGGAEKLWPLLPAALAGTVFAWCDSRNVAREGAAEVAGAVTFGILPAAFASSAGWNLNASLALAAVSLVRGVPTVLCVRTFLRFNKGQNVTIAPAVTAAVAGCLVVVWLVWLRLAPWTAAVFAMIFAVRTIWLLGWRPRLTPRRVGIVEAVLGTSMVLVLALTWKTTVGN
jgi:hypothetical protein